MDGRTFGYTINMERVPQRWQRHFSLELNRDRVVHHSEFSRLFTCLPLSSGLFEIIINLIFAYYINEPMKERFGSWSMMLGPVFGVYGGLIMVAFARRDFVYSGASAVTAPYYGSLLTDLVLNWGIMKMKWARLRWYVFSMTCNLLLGHCVEGISNFTTLAAFLGASLYTLMIQVRSWDVKLLAGFIFFSLLILACHLLHCKEYFDEFIYNRYVAGSSPNPPISSSSLFGMCNAAVRSSDIAMTSSITSSMSKQQDLRRQSRS